MPNCFQLWRDGAAVPLAQIDEEMCKHFGAPCDPVRYYECWYDVIGWGLAMGKTFAEIRASCTKDYSDYPQFLEIIAWLEANFTPNAWHERKGYER